MPNKDGKGPVWGGGPGAGLGRGDCGAANNSQNLDNGYGFGRGFGRRCGRRGFGWRRFFSSKNNLEELKNEEKFLQNELEAIQKEIKSESTK